MARDALLFLVGAWADSPAKMNELGRKSVGIETMGRDRGGYSLVRNLAVGTPPPQYIDTYRYRFCQSQWQCLSHRVQHCSSSVTKPRVHERGVRERVLWCREEQSTGPRLTPALLIGMTPKLGFRVMSFPRIPCWEL
jgi:hypothetical protein